jgi:hypothetical protein
LLEAFSQASVESPDIHLVIAGKGDANYVRKLREIARESDIGDRITWTGYLSDHMRSGALAAADAFILPSHGEFRAQCGGSAGSGSAGSAIQSREYRADGCGGRRGLRGGDDGGRDRCHDSHLAPGKCNGARHTSPPARQCYEKHWQIEKVCAEILQMISKPVVAEKVQVAA